MTEAFDPYYRWLGIPPREQPPHLYRLLGLELFESNPDVIDAMASRHIEYLQEINDGPHLKLAQQLLNELSAARRCLLNTEKKAAYDATLKATLQSEHKPPRAAPPPGPPSSAKRTVAFSDNREPNVPLAARRGADDGRDTQKPVAGTNRRSAKHFISSGHCSQNKRRAVLAASGLCCLIMLLTGGFWLGTRDSEQVQTAPSSVDQAKKERPAAREGLADLLLEPGQEPSTTGQTPTVVQRIDDAPPATITPGDALSSDQIDDATPADAQKPHNSTTPAIPASLPEPIPTEGLLLWLDAADATTLRLSDNSQLQHWDDKSAGGYRASVDSDGAGLELVPAVLDEKSVVRFSGTDWLKITGTADLLQNRAEYTFVTVARGARGTLISNGMGDADPFSFALSPGVERFRIGGQQMDATSNTTVEFHVRSLVVDADCVRWFVDGQPRGGLDAAPQAIEKANVLRIGCSYRNRHGAESIFQGDLAELMIYGRALGDDERQQLEAITKAKWLSGSTAAFSFDVVDQFAADDSQDMAVETDDAESTEPLETNDTAEHTENSPSTDAEPAAHSRQFVVLPPVHIEASAGSQLSQRDDGALLVDGRNKADETYRITLETDIAGITAILLEALPDDSLPGSGPGLGAGGVFSLAEFSVTVKSKADSDSSRAVTFWQARADDASQAKLSNDGDTATRWTVRRRGERVPVVYVANEPFGNPGGSLIELTLVQRENLGCFRISATSAPDPWKLPVDVETSDGGSEGKNNDSDALFVNLGGDAWQDPQGNRWVEAKSFVGGSFGYEGGQSVKTDEASNTMLGTARRGISAFRADVEPGDYEVQLVFSEHWTSNPQSRLFSVFIEQRPALSPRLGIGFGQPYIHRIPRVHVTASPLDIDLLPAHDGATTILNGVSIRRLK